MNYHTSFYTSVVKIVLVYQWLRIQKNVILEDAWMFLNYCHSVPDQGMKIRSDS
jgi:hypothetical protein